MRLFSYADKFGSARTGVLTDDGLVSGNQLERYLRFPLLTLGDPGTVALNEGLAAADLAMSEIQQSIFDSRDFREGVASYRERGLGMARFEGR